MDAVVSIATAFVVVFSASIFKAIAPVPSEFINKVSPVTSAWVFCTQRVIEVSVMVPEVSVTEFSILRALPLLAYVPASFTTEVF